MSLEELGLKMSLLHSSRPIKLKIIPIYTLVDAYGKTKNVFSSYL